MKFLFPEIQLPQNFLFNQDITHKSQQGPWLRHATNIYEVCAMSQTLPGTHILISFSPEAHLCLTSPYVTNLLVPDLQQQQKTEKTKQIRPEDITTNACFA